MNEAVWEKTRTSGVTCAAFAGPMAPALNSYCHTTPFTAEASRASRLRAVTLQTGVCRLRLLGDSHIGYQ